MAKHTPEDNPIMSPNSEASPDPRYPRDARDHSFLDADLEAEAEREARQLLNGGALPPPTRLSTDRVEELKEQHISVDQLHWFVRWRGRDRHWAKASELAEIPENVGWELENDPDIQEEIREERQRIQNDPAAAMAELMPRAIGNLEERLLSNSPNAAETVIKSNAELMRVQLRRDGGSGGKQQQPPTPQPQPSGNSSKKDRQKNNNEDEGDNLNETAGDSGALHERRSLNRVVERFRGAEEG